MTPTLLVAGLIALPLLIALAWQISIKLPDAIAHGFLVVRLELILALLLVVATAGTASAARRRTGAGFGARPVVVLLVACAMSAAIGNSPGLFLQSLAASAALILSIAVVAGLIVSRMVNRGAGLLAFWAVALAAVTMAAWQAGAAPLIARLLVQN